MSKKKPVFASLVIFFSFQAYAQVNEYAFPIKDEWMRQHWGKGLQVGDSVPDILLGKMINNHSGAKRLSDYKGKLVILSYWSTNCTPCLEDMPYLENLQRQFGDKIQVLLVNIDETQEQIDIRSDQWKSNGAKLKISKLPSTVLETGKAKKQTEFYQLFPQILRLSTGQSGKKGRG